MVEYLVHVHGQIIPGLKDQQRERLSAAAGALKAWDVETVHPNDASMRGQVYGVS